MIEDETTYAQLRSAAQAATEAGDHVSAALEWTSIRSHYPDEIEAYLEGVSALRLAGMTDEAEHLAALAHTNFPDDIGPIVELIGLADDQGNLEEVLRLCAFARSAFPESREGYVFAASALTEQGDDDAADAMLGEAVDAFPDDSDFRLAHARHAALAGRTLDAALRWDAVRVAAPSLIAGWTEGALSLMECGFSDAADAVCERAAQRFSDAADRAAILSVRIAMATRRGDWPMVLEYCAILRSRQPDDADAYAPALLALRVLDRLDEAEALAIAALRHSAADIGVITEYARLAIHREDLDAASSRYERLYELSPEAASHVATELDALRALLEGSPEHEGPAYAFGTPYMA